MKYEMAIPVLMAFGISVILGPLVIPFLRRLKVGQTVRDEGPESHLKKSGTPTMGGLMILTAIVATSLFYMKDYPELIPVLFLTLGFGLVGFLDDYIKVVLKRSMGLRAWQKMGLQLIITGVFAFYVSKVLELDLAMKIPFMEGKYLDFGWFNIPMLFIVVIGTDTGTNFTDGLDGLASSVTIMVATFFAVVAIGTASGVAPIACAAIGALLGFLMYNCYPAKVFMGDTGALALGGFVAASAYLLQMPLYLILVGFIYVIEVVSVMMQVSYFKLTHGKRIFKMAPIHHHFELCGWSETRVVAVFTTVTALLCLVALMGTW